MFKKKVLILNNSVLHEYTDSKSKTVLFHIIQFSVRIFILFTLLNVSTGLFQTMQFSICTKFSSIGPILKTLSGARTLGQSGPGCDGILQSSNITETSLSDCLVSHQGHTLW